MSFSAPPPAHPYNRPLSRAPMVYRDGPDAATAAETAAIEQRMAGHPALSWKRAAARRRFVLWLAIALATGLGGLAASTLFTGNSPFALRATIVFLFVLLFAWTAQNFFTALAGFFLHVRGADPYNPSNALKDSPVLSTTARVAVVMPVYNEDVANVFARLETMYTALQATTEKDRFTFFVLSDTTKPDVWVGEELAWKDICDRLGAHGHIVYRHRRSRIRKKSGNLADFCRRWGSSFDYMITLDSDSLMSASVMIKMAVIMDRRPDIGILQTAPLFFHANTPLARLQQFISQAYGPMFFRGLHYFQLGDGPYWGHNAIVRVRPFMNVGALPPTTGTPPWGGTILSHDSIEAAFVRRGGWSVWLAYDLDGSYEQSPATLALEIERDQRWCRGNLQHVKIMAMRGLSWGHRWMFLSGNLFYLSAFLWLALLLATTAEAVVTAIAPQVYFGSGRVLFPGWPEPSAHWGLVLAAATLGALFLPKVLGVGIVLADAEKRRLFGGAKALMAGFLIETVCSFLLAPIRMVYYAYFFATSLLGVGFEWKTSYRFAETLHWSDAFRVCWAPTLFAMLWTVVLFSFDRTLFWWVALVTVPLILSMPVAMVVSQGTLGRALERLGLLRVPTETNPVPGILLYEGLLAKIAGRARGFAQVVADLDALHFHLSLLGPPRRLAASIVKRRQALVEKAVAAGPAALAAAEKRELLFDPASLTALHARLRA